MKFKIPGSLTLLVKKLKQLRFVLFLKLKLEFFLYERSLPLFTAAGKNMPVSWQTSPLPVFCNLVTQGRQKQER